jgi:hypothetical protein
LPGACLPEKPEGGKMDIREEKNFKLSELKIKQERLFSDILSICNEGALPKAGYEQKVKDWFNDTLVKENGDTVPVRRETIDGREYIFDVPPWAKEIGTIEEAGQIAELRYHMALALRHKWENDFRTREAKAAMKRGEEAGDHAKLILKNYEGAKKLIDRDLRLWDMIKQYRENEREIEDAERILKETAPALTDAECLQRLLDTGYIMKNERIQNKTVYLIKKGHNVLDTFDELARMTGDKLRARNIMIQNIPKAENSLNVHKPKHSLKN